MKNVTAFAGGVGGAKLALGLAHVAPPQGLTVVVNTADDFEHLGLHISPDLDTVMYTLGGIANPDTGWGQVNETWQFLDALGKLGGDTWFRLGDRDLATHIERTRRLQEGQSLTDICAHLCRQLGVGVAVLPMSDQPVRTIVDTDDGALSFQDYFVRMRCEPRVKGFTFAGVESALAQPRVLQAIATTEVLIFCPSNPYVSIAPILALTGAQKAIAARRREGVPLVAVSPIVGGQAIKGPAAKMMIELGLESSCESVARYYGGAIDGLVIDEADRASVENIESMGIRVLVTDTIMRDLESKTRLAQETLAFAASLRQPLAEVQ